MNSLLTRNHTPIPRSISPLEDSGSVLITTMVNKPHTSVIRLHAHTEALEDSLSKSRDKRSQPSPQASNASSSSPQKRGLSEVSSSSPLKIMGRRSQRRFNTLPLPVRAESKIEYLEKEKSKEKDSIWAISGVKLEKFCKNLLKKPKKKHQKGSLYDQNCKSNDSDKDSPSKSPLVRTSSEPRTAGRSRFYVEKVHEFRENERSVELETTKENGKSKKKSDRFLKKKAKSTSLLQRNTEEKAETRTAGGHSSSSIPIKIKIRESQSNSSEEAFSPVFLKKDQRSRLAQTPEYQGQAVRLSEDPRKFNVFRNSVSSAEKDEVLLNHTRHQKEGPSSQSSLVKIRKLEREPYRRSRNVNPDLKSNGSAKDDHDDVDGVVIKRESILSDASRLKKVPEPSSSSSSSKRDKTLHKVLFSKTNGYLPADEDTIRRKTDATGTGYVTSGESCITTSPLSGEHSTLSDSGYSVTSNDPLFTDTGFLVLDSVGAASRIGASSIVPRCSNGVKNVNAGHIHSPSTKKENADISDQAGNPRDIQPVAERSNLDSNRLKSSETSSQRGAEIIEQIISRPNNYCNTYPQVKNSRKISDSYLSNDQTASSMNLTPGEVSDSAVTEVRSRLTSRMLGFSRQDFETLKHRAKSVEIILPKRSRQRGGKRRACSISRERLVVTVTTTTEEIRYPKPVYDELDDGRRGRKSDNLSKQELGTYRNGICSVISNLPDAKEDQLHSHSTETEHKGMQTSPDKGFMTTDFPFTTTEGYQVTGHDGVNPASGRHFSSIPHSEISGDQYVVSDGRTEDHPSFAASKAPFQSNLIKKEIDKNVFNADGQDAKSNSGVEYSRYLAGIKDTAYDNKAIHENQNEIQQSAENETKKQPKKLSAISYFDGSKWLTSSDEAASEEDQKTRNVNPHGVSETGKRCVETQTSEDIFLYLVPLTLDQSSQTNLSPVLLESEQNGLKGRAEDRNAEQTSSSSSGRHAVSRNGGGSIRGDQNRSNRRDSVKSIIAHEYGEMYSIFREIPPSLTYLKASLVSNEQFNASKDLKMALEKYPHLRSGSWSWGGRSVSGFGLMLAPSANQQRGRKIYDRVTAPESNLGEASELISYRYEPILEQFKLLG